MIIPWSVFSCTGSSTFLHLPQFGCVNVDNKLTFAGFIPQIETILNPTDWPTTTSTRVENFLNKSVCFFSSVIILINLFMTTFESAQWRKASHRSATFTRVENFPNQLVCSFSLLPQIKFTFTLFHWVCSCSWSWWVCWFPPETNLKIKEDKSLLKMHFKPHGFSSDYELQWLGQEKLISCSYLSEIDFRGSMAGKRGCWTSKPEIFFFKFKFVGFWPPVQNLDNSF